MKVLLLTGDQARHLHLARTLLPRLGALVIERREAFVPQPPAGLPEELAALFRRHFEERAAAELRFFGAADAARAELGTVPSLVVERDELNGPRVWDFCRAQQADLAISYGVHLLGPETLASLPPLRFNLHGGLSPWYRGVATHFWPSYLLEPQMTGTTLHEITARIDGGAVVHQTVAPLVRGDGLHDLACRAVQAAAADLPGLIEVVAGGRELAAVAQKTTGRLWLAEHWRPEHLRLVYELYGNRIVDAQLDGRLGRHQPRLVRAL